MLRNMFLKLHVIVLNTCGYVRVKLYFIRSKFTHVIEKSTRLSLFVTIFIRIHWWRNKYNTSEATKLHWSERKYVENDCIDANDNSWYITTLKFIWTVRTVVVVITFQSFFNTRAITAAELVWTAGRRSVCGRRSFNDNMSHDELQSNWNDVDSAVGLISHWLRWFLPRCSMQSGLSHRVGVCPSVCLSVTAWIVTKRKHLAKKVQLWLIGSRLLRFQWA